MDAIKVGDVITLASELLNINSYEAAKQINTIFHLGVEFEKQISKNEVKTYQCKAELIKQFEIWENQTFQLLCDYYHLLQKWIKLKDPENFLYVRALREIDTIDYYIDEIFINGTDEDKLWFWKNEKSFVKKINLILIKVKKGEYYE